MNKKEYTAPTLTVVTVKAERGYAGSLTRTFYLALLGENKIFSSQETWGTESLFGAFPEDTWIEE